MNYEINYETQLIIPIGKNSSKIIEQDDEYFIKNNTLSILEHSCEYFGSSLEGRKEGTKKLLGITHKSPIIIEESRKIIFFPTTSPEKEDCIWINLDKIEKYYKKENKKSTIQFKNGDIVDLNISIGSLTNQILRATRLKYILDDRIGTKEDNIL
jgi:competence protein ComK